MSTRQPQLSDLATSPARLSYALDSSSSKFQIVPSRTNDLHKPLRAVEFASACRLPIPALPNLYLCAGCQCLRNRIPRQPQFSVLASLSPCRVLLPGLDISSSSPCSSIICVADFSLTSLQLHKSTLLIYAPVWHGCQHP